MAVIYMPQDPRWTALAQLSQGVGQGINQSLIAQALKDPNPVTRLQKLLRLPGGINYASELTRMALEQAQIGEAGAKTANLNATTPTIGPKAQADIAAANARANYDTQRGAIVVPEAQAHIAELTASTADKYAETLKARADATKAQADLQLNPIKKQQLLAQAERDQALADQARRSVDFMNQLFPSVATANGNTTVGNNKQGSSAPTMPTMNDITSGMDNNQKLAFAAAAASGKPGTVATTLATIQRANKPIALPGDATKIAGNSAATLNNLDQIVNGVEEGDIRGGPVDNLIAWAQNNGWLKANNGNRAQMLETIHQLAYNRATSGGGFGGEWKIKLAKDTLPNFRKGPVQNVISAAVIAQDTLSELMAQKARFKGTKTVTAPLDAAIKQAQDVIKRANTLKTDKTGNVYMEGHLIQGKNGFVPSDMMPKGQAIKIGNNTYSAEDLNDTAILHGIDVSDVIATLRDYANKTNAGGQ